MLIITQYPIADCRRFVADPRQLKRPCFIRPGNDEFLRHFGAVGHRRIRYAYCQNEDHYCHADRALRVMSAPESRMLQLTDYASRLYHDGHYQCKVETKYKYTFRAIAPKKCENWLHALFGQHYKTLLRINTPRGAKPTPVTLFKAGPHLARLYLAASSFQSDEEHIRLRQKRMHTGWIYAGEPISILETNAAWNEMALAECGAVKAEGVWPGAELYHFHYEDTPCWIIVRREVTPEAIETCRNIRTLLLRIHAERQSLIQTMKFIASACRDEEFLSRPALCHLRNILERLLSPKRFGVRQTELVDTVFHIDRQYAGREHRDMLRMLGQIDADFLQQVDHKFIQEDLDCLYSPIEFEKIVDKLTAAEAAEADPLCREIVELAEKRDRLGLKKLLRKFSSSSKQMAGKVVRDLIIECVKECMWKGMTGMF